jgi:hypothetical protein
MGEALLFMQQAQGWIYLLLALAAIAYLRQSWLAFVDYRRSNFVLERERAGSRLIRSGAMLVIVLAAAAATFVLAEFFSPAVPSSERPSPAPTVFLLATPVTLTPAAAEGFSTATPLPPLAIDSSGCLNPLATISTPSSEAEIQGAVEIRGTADIPEFAFYRFEYISLSPGATWHAIAAGTDRVVEGSLGSWDTRGVAAGDYALRLVVTDAAGNAASPCVIRVRILPGG